MNLANEMYSSMLDQKRQEQFMAQGREEGKAVDPSAFRGVVLVSPVPNQIRRSFVSFLQLSAEGMILTVTVIDCPQRGGQLLQF